MNIKIISVGKLKEKYLKLGIDEYLKRLGAYAKVSCVEIPDEKVPETLSEKEKQMVLDKEGAKILDKITEGEFVIVMAIEGKLFSSEELAETINQCGISGKSKITFVIGGSLGLSHTVKQRGNSLMSFGKITLPHQLMKLVLTEQIYRSFRIINNQTYHK